MPSPELILNAFVRVPGHHAGAWRHPSSQPTDATDLRRYVHFAQTAERGLLQSLFVADSPGGGRDVLGWNGGLEPMTLLGALAAVTEHIGLIATASTTYGSPYDLARSFASLDHLSSGRAGWNIVTSSNVDAAYNYSVEPAAHADRYAQADEYMSVVTALWDSWEDDGLVFDKASGRQFDTRRIHAIDHVGGLHRVKGPLNAPRSPQGWPVLVQAGSSDDGKDFAARHAEAIFTVQQTIGDAQAFYADVKARASAAGRDPSLVKVLPGLCPFVGSTEAEAQRHRAELDEVMVPSSGSVNGNLLQFAGVDLSPFALDEPVPLDRMPSAADIQGSKSRFDVLTTLAQREPHLTLRQVLRRLHGSRGHFIVAGTPEQVADLIEAWFTRRAADGFNVMPPLAKTQLDLFVDHVVPILQRRGLFHTAYSGKTLREHYGLPRPASRYARAAV